MADLRPRDAAIKSHQKGAGHFEESSIWDGNVAVTPYNHDSSAYFGKNHTLSVGDNVVLTTKLGTRT